MKKGEDLPVDPARLKAQFPALTDDDLEAYAAMTRRILAAPTAEERARITRDALALGRTARDKHAAGTPLTEQEESALRYVTSLDKMQTPRH